MSEETRVAIMQPYIFPYIGQLNLIQAVDKFVFFDDVNFSNKAFTHKNVIQINNRSFTFTIPIKNKSQNTLIKNLVIHDLDKFKQEFLMTLYYAYKKSKYFQQGIDYVEKVLSLNTDSISDLAIFSTTEFFELLNIKKNFYKSSIISPATQGLQPADDRLISITKTLNSSYYINGPGGVRFYNKDYFSKQKVKLTFLQPQVDPQEMFSIIHVLMNNNKTKIKQYLNKYSLF